MNQIAVEVDKEVRIAELLFIWIYSWDILQRHVALKADNNLLLNV